MMRMPAADLGVPNSLSFRRVIHCRSIFTAREGDPPMHEGERQAENGRHRSDDPERRQGVRRFLAWLAVTGDQCKETEHEEEQRQ